MLKVKVLEPLKQSASAKLAQHEVARLRRSTSSIDALTADLLEKTAESGNLPEKVKVSCGEAIRTNDQFPIGLKNTLDDPTVVAADASEQRSILAAKAGVLELALDASETIESKNSLEKMQVYMMSLQFRLAMDFGARAQEATEPKEAIAFAKASTNATRSFSQGMDSLNAAKRGGRQVVTVQHVDVNEGAQAIITANPSKKA